MTIEVLVILVFVAVTAAVVGVAMILGPAAYAQEAEADRVQADDDRRHRAQQCQRRAHDTSSRICAAYPWRRS